MDWSLVLLNLQLSATASTFAFVFWGKWGDSKWVVVACAFVSSSGFTGFSSAVPNSILAIFNLVSKHCRRVLSPKTLNSKNDLLLRVEGQFPVQIFNSGRSYPENRNQKKSKQPPSSIRRSWNRVDNIWFRAFFYRRNYQKRRTRAARMLANSSFVADGLKTIEDVIETIIVVFKALNSLAFKYLSDLFRRN